MKKQSLIDGPHMTAIWIVAASIVTALITWLLTAALYLMKQNGGTYPVNYYEPQVPFIDQYMCGENTRLLSQENEMGLKNSIEGDGVPYQVVDSSVIILYGANTNPTSSSEANLINHLNTTEAYSGKNIYLHIIPLMGEDGKIEGIVTLVYKAEISASGSGGRWVLDIVAVTLFSSVLHIIPFTMLFPKQFVKQTNRSLQFLMKAAGKIKDKDLDFEIRCYSGNELEELRTASSEMQGELKTSLPTQWEMERERAKMIEALAHDLETLTSIVLVYTESLLDSKNMNPERSQRHLSVAEENVQRCSNLVQQMQAASEPEQAGRKLELTEVDLYEFLSRKVKHYELQVREKTVSIELYDDANIYGVYSPDTDRLDRTFDNLVSNSLRYTPANGEILVSAPADQKAIIYRVCGMRCGFNKRDLERATEQFYRGDETRQSGEGHPGLGLYTLKQLIHQLGGRIEPSSRKGGGVCVQSSQEIF